MSMTKRLENDLSDVASDEQRPYKRILLKLSGQALSGEKKVAFDTEVIEQISEEIKQVILSGVQLGIVIGGGNLFRGEKLSQIGIDRVTADHMGMLATVINALAMRDALERIGIATRVMSAIPMSGLLDHYDRRKAIHHLNQLRVVIFTAGTGTPLVTTDSAASLRSIEIEADILLKATNVDGVYSGDPKQDTQAKRYEKLTYREALSKELGVMDLSAFCQCRDYNMPLRVFNIYQKNALYQIAQGNSDIGTLISQ